MSAMYNGNYGIAMLGHKRIPSREGGVEIVVEELATRIAQEGYSVTCFNRTGHHACGEELDCEQINMNENVRLKSVFTIDIKGAAAVTSSFSAAFLAAIGKYDVVHFHAEGPCAMMWLPKLFGKRCIATIHGLDHKRKKWGKFASWYIRAGEKCAVKFADEIIVLTKCAKEYFDVRYGRKTVLIPNGVSAAKVVEPKRMVDLYGLRKDDYILFLGRLVPEKGIHYLIKAFKMLRTNKKLVIAGGTSDSNEYLRELQKLVNGDRNILFTGFVHGRLLDELLSNAYIYVLPSDLEGMPISLLEAMSYGNCCVTSDIPECAEVVSEYGITFAKGNIDDLASKLQELCDNPSKTALYKCGAAKYVCDKYNWDDVAARTLELYFPKKTQDKSGGFREINNESAACKQISVSQRGG